MNKRINNMGIILEELSLIHESKAYSMSPEVKKGISDLYNRIGNSSYQRYSIGDVENLVSYDYLKQVFREENMKTLSTRDGEFLSSIGKYVGNKEMMDSFTKKYGKKVADRLKSLVEDYIEAKKRLNDYWYSKRNIAIAFDEGEITSEKDLIDKFQAYGDLRKDEMRCEAKLVKLWIDCGADDDDEESRNLTLASYR